MASQGHEVFYFLPPIEKKRIAPTIGTSVQFFLAELSLPIVTRSLRMLRLPVDFARLPPFFPRIHPCLFSSRMDYGSCTSTGISQA